MIYGIILTDRRFPLSMDATGDKESARCAEFLAEYGLLKFRVQVEIRWLQKWPRTRRSRKFLLLRRRKRLHWIRLFANFNEDAARIKTIERTTENMM